MTTSTTHAAVALETCRRDASFLLVDALWGCSNAVIRHATETGSSTSSRSRKEQAGMMAGLKALIGTKAARRT
ncbi:hypothetical protein VYU27_006857 [Nannochloropsis oceanica]